MFQPLLPVLIGNTAIQETKMWVTISLYVIMAPISMLETTTWGDHRGQGMRQQAVIAWKEGIIGYKENKAKERGRWRAADSSRGRAELRDRRYVWMSVLEPRPRAILRARTVTCLREEGLASANTGERMQF